jgi:hypothetical protein
MPPETPCPNPCVACVLLYCPLFTTITRNHCCFLNAKQTRALHVTASLWNHAPAQVCSQFGRTISQKGLHGLFRRFQAGAHCACKLDTYAPCNTKPRTKDPCTSATTSLAASLATGRKQASTLRQQRTLGQHAAVHTHHMTQSLISMFSSGRWETTQQTAAMVVRSVGSSDVLMHV